MKLIVTLILSFNIILSFGQINEFDTYLQNGKAEFTKEFDEQDFTQAVFNLEKAVSLRPSNAEAHYYLGYAYSRLNSKDARTMINVNHELTIKSSEQFELINKLYPKYKGELFILDPYSKITSEWGSLATRYWVNNNTDSMKWAFSEGKKRGGFNGIYLSISKIYLDICPPNAILLSSGDNFFFSLLYLQLFENHRLDVSVIDVALLATIWYPKVLVNNHLIQFNLSPQVLDTIEYCPWPDSTLTIGNFSWMLKPTYQNYILRNDRVLLSLMQENNFSREIFFTYGFDNTLRLGLENHIRNYGLINQLNPSNLPDLSFQTFEYLIMKGLLTIKDVNTNSKMQLQMVDYIRFTILSRAGLEIQSGQLKNAKHLLGLIQKYANMDKYPTQYKETPQNIEKIKQLINDYR